MTWKRRSEGDEQWQMVELIRARRPKGSSKSVATATLSSRCELDADDAIALGGAGGWADWDGGSSAGKIGAGRLRISTTGMAARRDRNASASSRSPNDPGDGDDNPAALPSSSLSERWLDVEARRLRRIKESGTLLCSHAS